MTLLLFSLRRWLGRRIPAASVVMLALALGLVLDGGCAKQAESPGLGGGGAGTTMASTGTGGAMGTGGKAATGGMGTTSHSSSSSSGSATTTSSTTTSSGGTGGMGGMGSGGMGGTGGMGSGGMGGGFMPPLGSADYPAEHEPNNIKVQANPLQPGTKGFTASIYPLGDVDVFEFQVTVDGTSATVATSDGMGGCPAGAKTYVRIFDDSNMVLAQDNGQNGCVSFTPANTSSLISLSPGKYYVHVENAALSTLPFYIVDIRVTPPFCGDSIVQVGVGEQCDHGANNGTPADGCTATCQIKGASYINETEPNDTQATGNVIDGHTGAVGQIKPVGDIDYYTFSVTVAGSSVTAEVSDGFGGCPLGFDSKLTLWSPAMAALATDFAGGVSPCSKISPQVYMGATNLPVGKYALSVERSSPATQQYYVLKLNVAPPGCGDGILPEGNKQCDPGPGLMNPGCSATCQLTGDFIPETEPNDTQNLANPLGTHAGFIAAIKPIGDLDYFSFTVPGPTSLVFIQTSNGIGGCPPGFNSKLSLYDPMGNLLVADTNSGVGTCSLISPVLYNQAMNLAAGTYKTRVEFVGGNSTQWEYVVTIYVKQPGCGDGIVEAGEQCDDGPANGTPGDGCTATCQAIAPWEIEVNGSLATATPPWPGFNTWKGHITPVGKHSYFKFTLTAPGTVTLADHNLDTPTVCSFDSVLHLDDHLGNELTYDDDSGVGPGEPGGGKCALIANYALQPGTYYVWEQHYMDTKMIPNFQLDIAIQ
jgi:cysteine-rich repeat protein